MVNSRNKGASGEREFASLIYDQLGVTLIRNLEQVRSGGHDLIVTSDCPLSKSLDRYAIEVKRYRTTSNGQFSKWWGQTIEQAQAVNKTPLLAYRADRQPWWIVLPFQELSGDLTEHYSDIDGTIFMSISAFCKHLKRVSDPVTVTDSVPV